MKSIQLIKQVNNTELGKGGTHETYILIPQDLNVSDLFEENNVKYSFVDKDSLKEYKIRLTSGREKRIVGLGPFYSDKNLSAGDKVLLEKRILQDGRRNYYISLQRSSNTVFFQKVRSYFEAMTTENVNAVLDKDFSSDDNVSVKVEYYGEIQKRTDSPTKTKVYNILVGGNNIQSNYQDRDMIGLQYSDNKIKLIETKPWEKYVVEGKE